MPKDKHKMLLVYEYFIEYYVNQNKNLVEWGL